MGNFLTMGYKSTLLSTLVKIRYEKSIETLVDLDTSGLPLLISKHGYVLNTMIKDQRPVMKSILSKSILFQYVGKRLPPQYDEM